MVYLIIMKKIDCHTHIVNREIRDEYFSRTDGYALVMQMPERLLEGQTFEEDSENTVKSDPRLFMCACIDIKEEIEPQLEAIEGRLDELRIVGLKIYLTYMSARASDERLQPIYRFASRHRLGVTFHTGLCSLVLPSDQDMEGSNAEYIGEMAAKYPDVGFVAAHMDDPRIRACMRICCDHPNMFTDFSGLFEDGYESDKELLLSDYGGTIRSCENSAEHVMLGTDFCPPINLRDIEAFEEFMEKIFEPGDLDKVYFANALRAFPRLGKYIGE